jgi:hypothetical protein
VRAVISFGANALATSAFLLPPPLRGRAGEGGSRGHRGLWLGPPPPRRGGGRPPPPPRRGHRGLWLTPLPTLLRSVDLPLKGGGEESSA